MLKSEALGAIIDISDKNNREFKEFGQDCDKLSEIAAEYPELMHYLIDAAITIAGDNNMNPDAAPKLQKTYLEIDTNLSSEESYEALNKLYKRNQRLAMQVMNQLIMKRPYLAEKMFDQVLQDSKNDTHNSISPRAMAVTTMILATDDQTGSDMIDKIFTPEQYQHTPELVQNLYSRLGRFFYRPLANGPKNF